MLAVFMFLMAVAVGADAPTPELVLQLGHWARSGPEQVLVSPDGQYLLTTGADGRVVLWDAVERVEIRAFTVYNTPVEAVAWAADSRSFVTGGATRVYVWDLATLETVAAFEAKSVVALALSPDGSRLGVIDGRATTTIWDLESRTRVREIPRGETRGPQALAFSPDGRRLWLAGATQRQIDIETGEELLEVPIVSGLPPVYAPDGTRVLVGTEARVAGRRRRPMASTFALLDAQTGRMMWSTPSKQEARRLRPPYSVQFSPDGGEVWMGAMPSGPGQSPNTVEAQAYAVHTGASRRLFGLTLPQGEWPVTVVLDAAQVVSMSSDPVGHGNIGHVWNAAAQQKVWSFRRAIQRLGLWQASPDGTTLAVARQDRHQIELWDLTTGRRQRTLEDHDSHLSALAFHPKGTQLLSAVARTGELRIHDVATGARVATTTLSARMSHALFVKDGAAVLATTEELNPDRTVTLGVHAWDPNTGALRLLQQREFGEGAGVIAVAADGRRLAVRRVWIPVGRCGRSATERCTRCRGRISTGLRFRQTECA